MSNKFVKVARTYANSTTTENGAFALKSTGNHLLDLYGCAGGLRNEGDDRLFDMFDKAVADNALLAAKLIFYIRDIREGLGERSLARRLLVYAAEKYPNMVKDNIHLLGEYGRFDDMYSLIDTPLEDHMWTTMKKIFEDDLRTLSDPTGKSSPTLLAKWIKTADASSKKTRELGIKTAINLGYGGNIPLFKRLVRRLRKQIDIVESKMSANQWGDIEYRHVPSRASMIYKSAFRKHDGDRYDAYIESALKGEATIQSATVTPYDLIHQTLEYRHCEKDLKTIEAQWRQLPDYVDSDTNVLCMVDVSGSMSGRPIEVALGLGIYFAEHNRGDFHDLFMTFSEKPDFVTLKGETLNDKLHNMINANWGMNTDLARAFRLVLSHALRHNIPKSDMPKSIIVISDMEIDQADDNNWTFYDAMYDEYKTHGYEIPNLIFWNVNSRHSVFHVDSERKGVQLASGESATIFKQVIDNIGLTPMEAMLNVLNSERYAPVKLSDDESDIVKFPRIGVLAPIKKGVYEEKSGNVILSLTNGKTLEVPLDTIHHIINLNNQDKNAKSTGDDNSLNRETDIKSKDSK